MKLFSHLLNNLFQSSTQCYELLMRLPNKCRIIFKLFLHSTAYTYYNSVCMLFLKSNISVALLPHHKYYNAKISIMFHNSKHSSNVYVFPLNNTTPCQNIISQSYNIIE